MENLTNKIIIKKVFKKLDSYFNCVLLDIIGKQLIDRKVEELF